MTSPSTPVSAPPTLPPLWSVELLDVIGRRGRFAVAVAGVLSALALLTAVVVPAVLPPRAIVGGLVGVTALAAGMALALALDALDVRIRGPRHVRSSGGELVALLPDTASTVHAGDLATAVRAVQTPGTTLHLGIAPVGEDVTSTVAWTRALGEALAESGSSVLLVDIATGTTSAPGILEVVRDRTPLADVVQYDDGRSLAHAGPGADRLQALQALITLPTVLPEDVDVLLVALPQVVTRSAVNASRVLDQVLFVAEANLSSRVELMASLDALRVAGCSPQVVLVDAGTYRVMRPTIAPELPGRASARLDPVPLGGGARIPTSVPVPVPVPVPAVTAPAAVPLLTTPLAAPALAPEPEPEAQLAPEPEPILHSDPEPDPDPETEGESEPEPEPQVALPLSDGEPSSPLRTVEVLEAAARARAETTLEASTVDTVPMDRSEVLAPTRPPAPTPAPAPAASPTPAPAPAPAPGDEDLTTELKRDSAPLPSWASAVEEEDLLRTTVQMSAFSEELDLRDEH
jgi:hypothetical protein